MNITILHDQLSDDARPDDLDTLQTVADIERALTKLGHKTSRLPVNADLEAFRQALNDQKPDYAFNLVEAIDGQQAKGYLAATVLEKSSVAYSGCTAEALRIGADKLLTKRMLSQAGILTPDWIEAGSSDIVLPENQMFIVKSLTEDSSVGIDQSSVVPTAQVQSVIDNRKSRFGGEWFAEAFIKGREFNMGLLVNDHHVEILPAAEMIFTGYGSDMFQIVDYKAKWDTSSFEYKNSNRTFQVTPKDSKLHSVLADICIRTWDLFELSGYARVDFRVDQLGNPWVLEINPNPGIARDSGFVAGCAQAGISYEQMVARLIKSA